MKWTLIEEDKLTYFVIGQKIDMEIEIASANKFV